MDKRIMDTNMEIAQEDIDLLVNLNPVRTPETNTKEILVPADDSNRADAGAGLTDND